MRTAPGRGATFRIALPLAPEAQGGTADDPDTDESGKEAGGLRLEADGAAGEADGAVDKAGDAVDEAGEDVVTFGTKVRGAPPSAG